MMAILLTAAMIFAPADVVTTVSDSAITTSIKTEIGVNPHVNTFGIHIRTEDGVVTLAGRVEDQTQKQVAEDIARNTKGVVDVVNKLTIIPRTITDKDERGFKQRASDKQVAAAVRSRMVYHGESKGLKIGVDVVDGHVTLTGVVNTEEQKDELGKLAANTKGAESVVNDLVVRKKKKEGFVSGLGRDMSDEYLEKKIESAILFTKRVSIREIGVEVDDGICYLTGVVDNAEQKQVAGDIAEGYKGIQEVVNALSIREGGVTLEEVKKEIKQKPDPNAETNPGKIVGSKAVNEHRMKKKSKEEEAEPAKKETELPDAVTRPAERASGSDSGGLSESDPTDEPAPKIEAKPLDPVK